MSFVKKVWKVWNTELRGGCTRNAKFTINIPILPEAFLTFASKSSIGPSMLWSEEIGQYTQDIAQHTKGILQHT